MEERQPDSQPAQLKLATEGPAVTYSDELEMVRTQEAHSRAYNIQLLAQLTELAEKQTLYERNDRLQKAEVHDLQSKLLDLKQKHKAALQQCSQAMEVSNCERMYSREQEANANRNRHEAGMSKIKCALWRTLQTSLECALHSWHANWRHMILNGMKRCLAPLDEKDAENQELFEENVALSIALEDAQAGLKAKMLGATASKERLVQFLLRWLGGGVQRWRLHILQQCVQTMKRNAGTSSAGAIQESRDLAKHAEAREGLARELAKRAEEASVALRVQQRHAAGRLLCGVLRRTEWWMMLTGVQAWRSEARLHWAHLLVANTGGVHTEAAEHFEIPWHIAEIMCSDIPDSLVSELVSYHNQQCSRIRKLVTLLEVSRAGEREPRLICTEEEIKEELTRVQQMLSSATQARDSAHADILAASQRLHTLDLALNQKTHLGEGEAELPNLDLELLRSEQQAAGKHLEESRARHENSVPEVNELHDRMAGLSQQEARVSEYRSFELKLTHLRTVIPRAGRRLLVNWERGCLVQLLHRWACRMENSQHAQHAVARLEAHDRLEGFIAESGDKPDFLEWHLEQVALELRSERASAGRAARTVALRQLQMAFQRYNRQIEIQAVISWSRSTQDAFAIKVLCLEKLGLLECGNRKLHLLQQVRNWRTTMEEERVIWQGATEWHAFTTTVHTQQMKSACLQLLFWVQRAAAMRSRALLQLWSRSTLQACTTTFQLLSRALLIASGFQITQARIQKYINVWVQRLHVDHVLFKVLPRLHRRVVGWFLHSEMLSALRQWCAHRISEQREAERELALSTALGRVHRRVVGWFLHSEMQAALRQWRAHHITEQREAERELALSTALGRVQTCMRSDMKVWRLRKVLPVFVRTMLRQLTAHIYRVLDCWRDHQVRAFRKEEQSQSHNLAIAAAMKIKNTSLVLLSQTLQRVMMDGVRGRLGLWRSGTVLATLDHKDLIASRAKQIGEDSKDILQKLWDTATELEQESSKSAQLELALQEANAKTEKLRQKLQVAHDECMELQQQQAIRSADFQYRVVSKPVAYS